MAGPTKSPDERRTEIVRFRATLQERVTVEAMANAAELTVSEFARRAVLGQRIAPPTTRKGGVPVGLLSDLGRIGNNLNQIARRANASGNVPAHLSDLLEQVQETQRHIMDLVAGAGDE